MPRNHVPYLVETSACRLYRDNKYSVPGEAATKRRRRNNTRRSFGARVSWRQSQRNKIERPEPDYRAGHWPGQTDIPVQAPSV